MDLWIFSVLLTLFLGFVCHLEVHHESSHLLCSDTAADAGLSYKELSEFMSLPIIITFPKYKSYFTLMHDILGCIHTPQPFSQHTLSCLLGSNGVISHTCMFSVHFRIECLSQARGLLCVSADQSYLDL